MRKLFYSLILLAAINIHAQDICYTPLLSTTTVNTPKNSPVQGLILDQITTLCYNSLLNYLATHYPNVTILENPTSQYNCHSYAFHLSEGNTNKVWIDAKDLYTNPNLSKYWTDGSFIEVCNESDGEKAHYYENSGDHSALTTSAISGEYESKWGKNARVIHAPTYCPYDAPYYRRKYYASTAITGTTTPLCSGTRVFSVKNITGATYSWSVSPGLTIQSGGSTNAVTVAYDVPYSNAWAEVEITTPCSNTTATRRIYFDAGSPTVFYEINPNGMENCYQTNAYYYFNIAPNPEDVDITAHEWGYRPYGTTSETIVGNPNAYNTTATVIFPSTGLYEVFVRPKNSCGTGQESSAIVDVVSSCGGYFRVATSPNPAGSNLNVVITDELNEVKALNAHTDILIELQLLNTGTVHKQWTFKNTQNAFNLNLAGISKGWYIITVTKGKYRSSAKILVQ